MDWTDIEARWDQYRDQAQERWGRLTDEDLEAARNGRNELITCVRRRYGLDPALAERHVDDWIKTAM